MISFFLPKELEKRKEPNVGHHVPTFTRLIEKKKKKSKALEPRLALIAAGAYPGFCSMKRLEVFLLPLDGMLVHRRSLPRNYTPGWREAV